VIFGELGEAPVAEEKEPAVSDVSSEEAAADDRRRGDRGAHAPQLGHRDRLVVDLEVRLLDRTAKTLADGPAARRALHLARDHLERERARDLAGVFASRAGGHREQ